VTIQLKTDCWPGDAEIAGLDIAGLDISGRVCESELGNMLSFWSSVFAQKYRLDRRPRQSNAPLKRTRGYGRSVKTQPTGTRVEKVLN